MIDCLIVALYGDGKQPFPLSHQGIGGVEIGNYPNFPIGITENAR
jgi:hypothetical protein